MSLDKLRKDIIAELKKGLPFLIASILIWLLIAIVNSLGLQNNLNNILVFACSMPMLPIAWIIGKRWGFDIFKSENPLSKLGFLFTMNQVLYLLIVMWVFNAVPEKMTMVYAMVYGAHLLPYSWLYMSFGYKIFAVIIPIISLILGNLTNAFVLSIGMCVIQIIFVIVVFREYKQINS